MVLLIAHPPPPANPLNQFLNVPQISTLALSHLPSKMGTPQTNCCLHPALSLSFTQPQNDWLKSLGHDPLPLKPQELPASREVEGSRFSKAQANPPSASLPHQAVFFERQCPRPSVTDTLDRMEGPHRVPAPMSLTHCGQDGRISGCPCPNAVGVRNTLMQHGNQKCPEGLEKWLNS